MLYVHKRLTNIILRAIMNPNQLNTSKPQLLWAQLSSAAACIQILSINVNPQYFITFLVSAIAERTPYKALCPYVCMSVCMSQIFNHHKLKFYIVSVTYR